MSNLLEKNNNIYSPETEKHTEMIQQVENEKQTDGSSRH